MPRSCLARLSAPEALQALLEGNGRFAEGKAQPLLTSEQRAELANGQAPFAMVLGCADSRVPVETVFDHQPGDIFTVRVAGNFAHNAGIGSLEYGFSVLKASLLMVLGHTSCGAVNAAFEFARSRKPLPGHMQSFVEAIVPNVRASASAADAVVANVRANVDLLKRSEPILARRRAREPLGHCRRGLRFAHGPGPDSLTPEPEVPLTMMPK